MWNQIFAAYQEVEEEENVCGAWLWPLLFAPLSNTAPPLVFLHTANLS